MELSYKIRGAGWSVTITAVANAVNVTSAPTQLVTRGDASVTYDLSTEYIVPPCNSASMGTTTLFAALLTSSNFLVPRNKVETNPNEYTAGFQL